MPSGFVEDGVSAKYSATFDSPDTLAVLPLTFALNVMPIPILLNPLIGLFGVNSTALIILTGTLFI